MTCAPLLAPTVWSGEQVEQSRGGATPTRRAWANAAGVGTFSELSGAGALRRGRRRDDDPNEPLTKPALASGMLRRTLHAGVPAPWVAGDEGYSSKVSWQQRGTTCGA